MAMIPAFASLLTLLVLPLLHNSLSHAHASCGAPDAPYAGCLAEGGAPELASRPVGSCAICIAGSPARRALSVPGTPSLPAVVPVLSRFVPREAPPSLGIAPLAVTPARAPPACA
jgi:hypothetical protein